MSGKIAAAHMAEKHNSVLESQAGDQVFQGRTLWSFTCNLAEKVEALIAQYCARAD